MEINVKKVGRYWKVVFNHGAQYFTLDYSVETKEEAEWMKTMLTKCFKSAYGNQGNSENANCAIPDVDDRFSNEELERRADGCFLAITSHSLISEIGGIERKWIVKCIYKALKMVNGQ